MLDVNVGLKSGQDIHLSLKRKMLNLVDVGKINGIEEGDGTIELKCYLGQSIEQNKKVMSLQ